MKLSQLSTDGAMDALCRLTPYITHITTDQEFVAAIGKVVNLEEVNLYGQYVLIMDRLGEAIPILLNTHRADVYGILSVLNEKTPQEIAAQPVRETFSQLREVFQDEELLGFFKSFLGRGKKEPSGPSAAPPG
ncbi:hypothetical protein D7X94_08660 [Acutalibacter sp. 1XD8-33]|uniref:hypothetical protein n=1 Tax=Acutalibacter sp. 1XD8-33 TaxID=2320081 RepID=UPI000EA01BC9|nr:hypothetical protein [Acutalibacter sp. 1XD8-33]RKJ40208.1 hypothetical protein D7X94_08660 [Acutalibacter sp. 1XD8-33]